MTYSRLLSETRMRKAAIWLENTDKPIAEIASELGYQDASNFTRAFRRQAGMPGCRHCSSGIMQEENRVERFVFYF